MIRLRAVVDIEQIGCSSRRTCTPGAYVLGASGDAFGGPVSRETMSRGASARPKRGELTSHEHTDRERGLRVARS